ncbi:hypothetical protein INS49_002585 [Diaporthe citri]|uniref:uncharacterized protein n=1 Tax=Diaporthe citri TaxID=83186 RepID=UPI001C7EBBAF|nr:uncharacterized protein INS49_002585 [Diaporthe citri]KAG6368379.1 hypothetical protein INS49_002585 [Diaporthe citri]
MASGATIRGPQLRIAVGDHGFSALEYLAPLIEDFPAKAVLALAEAARLNNFEAVEFLLRAGVDPNSFIPGGDLEDKNTKGSSYSVQAIAAGCAKKGKSSSCDMVKLLAEHGARLVVTPNDSSPCDFTGHLLRYNCSDTSRKVKYAIQDCLGKCTPLQAAARRGNERLVHLLLGGGSNVNSRACGRLSWTALQAICSWDTATEQEYERKMRICQLLISHGADTNAAPARIEGWTALQRAAILGHLEMAALLLRNGALINAPSCVISGSTALDAAVYGARLDMVKFLLNANALSSFRGTTGYDGAIKLAKRQGHSVIADLIREHATNNMSLGLINPELLKPQEDYHIYGYITDEEYSIYSYNTNGGTSGVMGEDCTIESLCRRLGGVQHRVKTGGTIPPHNWARTVDQQTRDEVEATLAVGFNMARSSALHQRNDALREATFQVPHELARLNEDAPDFRLEDLGPMEHAKKLWDRVGERFPSLAPFVDCAEEARVFLYFPNGAAKATAVFVAVNAELKYPLHKPQQSAADGVLMNGVHAANEVSLFAGFWVFQHNLWAQSHPAVIGGVEGMERLPVIFNFRDKAFGALYYTRLGLTFDTITILSRLNVAAFDLDVVIAF